MAVRSNSTGACPDGLAETARTRGADRGAQATVMVQLERFHHASDRIKDAISILEKRKKTNRTQLPFAYLKYAEVLDALEKPDEAQGYRKKAKELAEGVEGE